MMEDEVTFIKFKNRRSHPALKRKKPIKKRRNKMPGCKKKKK